MQPFRRTAHTPERAPRRRPEPGTARLRLLPGIALAALLASAAACGASRGGDGPAEPPAPPADDAGPAETADAGTAVRRALPRRAHPGDTMTVTLDVDPPAGASSFTVRESPPRGWTVTEASAGAAVDRDDGRVEWRLSGDSARRVTYRLRVPRDAGGPGEFAGSARWGEGSRPVGGPGSVEVVPRDRRPPAGRAVLRRAAERPEPLGIAALDALSERLRGRPLGEVVRVQNRWARRHVDAFRSAPPLSDYRLMLAPFVEGPGGLRRAFAPVAGGRPTAWARSQIAWLGADAFTRLTAFLEGFPPGSDAFRMVFGGTRRLDAGSGRVLFLGTELEAAGSGDAGGGTVDGPAARSRYAAAVRRAIFGFYRSWRDGDVDRSGVRRFNRAMVAAGGPALVAWGAVAGGRAAGAADTAAAPASPAGLSPMAAVLEELGHQVRRETAEGDGGAPGAAALAALDSARRARAAAAPSRRSPPGTRPAGALPPTGPAPLGVFPAVPRLGPGRAGELVLEGRRHLPTAKIGTRYAHALDVDGGRPPFLWTVVDGWLPDGTHLDRKRGRLVGVPEETGLFNFTLSVMGSEGATGRASFAVAVAEATAAILVAKTEQVHDGEPKTVAVRTSPPGLEVSVTYDGAREPPVKPGEYTVSVRVTEPGYRGTTRATLHISKAGSHRSGPGEADDSGDADP